VPDSAPIVLPDGRPKDEELVFLRKTLAVIGGQFFLTFIWLLGAAVSGRGSPFWDFCGNHILLVLCSLLYFFTLILLVCIKSLRMLIPVNYLVLGVNTISMAFMFGAATKNDNFEYWFPLICALMLVTCGLFAGVMLVRTASKL
jgi:hypothetical protein